MDVDRLRGQHLTKALDRNAGGTTGVVVLHHHTPPTGEDLGDRSNSRLSGVEAGGVVGPGLDEEGDGIVLERLDERIDADPLAVEPDADDFGTCCLEHVEQWRERRVFDHHPVTKTNQFSHHTIECVECAIDHRHGLDLVGPSSPQLHLQRRQQRRIDIRRDGD